MNNSYNSTTEKQTLDFKMGRGYEQTFLQRRNTDGQQAHEKMFNITNFLQNVNQNHEILPCTCQLGDYHKDMPVCAQSCPAFCNPMGCRPPGPSAHGIFQTRILEWGVISCFRGSFQPKDQSQVFCISCIGQQDLYHQCHLGNPSKK